MSATHPFRAEVQTLPGADPLIRLQGVGRRYTVGDQEVVALAGVSLEIRSEEFVVVLGPSGCGKTTLLNMIGALDSPTEGRVVVAGQDITRASRKELPCLCDSAAQFSSETRQAQETPRSRPSAGPALV